MKELALQQCLVITAMSGVVATWFATDHRPNCLGSPAFGREIVKSWHYCIGQHINDLQTFQGEFQNGEYHE